eukprot:symbB.v1.2.018526.t1/scaffold1481.1/size116218/5
MASMMHISNWRKSRPLPSETFALFLPQRQAGGLEDIDDLELWWRMWPFNEPPREVGSWAATDCPDEQSEPAKHSASTMAAWHCIHAKFAHWNHFARSVLASKSIGHESESSGSGSEIDADVALKLLLVVEAQKPKAPPRYMTRKHAHGEMHLSSGSDTATTS